MPGPLPKDPNTRARRNRSTTAAKLVDRGDARPTGVPPLPAGLPWHELTQAWWADVWASPMAGEYLKVDVHGLFRLAMLVNRFWMGDPSVAAEIRLTGQRFGLSPFDRRQLQWEIARVEERERGRQPQPPTEPVADPRELLFAVEGGKKPARRRRSSSG